jgi:type II secretory pathway component PulM
VKNLRLTRIQVGIVGLVLMIGVAVLFALAFIRPMQAELNKTKDDAQQQEDYAKTNRTKAQKDLESATAQKAIVKGQFDKIMETRMPKVNLSDPIAGMFRLWSYPREEGMLMDKWFKSSGATVNGYSFAGFTSSLADPNVKILGPYQWNLSVQVKDFPSLLKWLEKIPKAPRFMVMSQGVTIGGPRQPGQPLNASVPVTVYEWTKAAQTALEALRAPVAAAGDTGGAAGAPGGGMGGGMGGGRGGMGGGGRGGMGGGRGGMGGGMRGGG